MADGEILERLVVQFDADLNKLNSKLDKVIRSNYDAAHRVETAWAEVDVGKFIDSSFSASRMALFEAAGEKAGIFAGALEHLGPVALAAGAAIGTLVAGSEFVEKVGEWADELEKASIKLGLTAEGLQRLDYVAVESGIGIEATRDSLMSLNAAFGAVQAGIARAQQVKPFIALGFGENAEEVQKNLQQFKTFEDVLDALPGRFAKAGSAAEQAAVAKRLGIEALIPLLHEGAGGLEELKAKTEGYSVVSNEAVIHTAELNKELNTSKQRIKEAANALGTEMAPALTGINQLLADSLEGWVKMINAMVGGMTLAEKAASAMEEGRRHDQNAANIRSQPGFNLPARREMLEAAAEAEESKAQAAYDTAKIASTALHIQQMKDDLQAQVARGGSSRTLVPGKAGGGKDDNGPAFNEIKNTAITAYEAWRQLAEALAKDENFISEMDKANFGKLQKFTTVDNLQSNPNFHIFNGQVFTDDQYAELHDRMAYTVRGALDAAFHGGIPGLLKWFGEQFLQTLLDKWAESLADGLLNSGVGSGGGGGLGNLISNGLHFLGFADGTNSAPGGLSIVGERGPELMNVPRGAQIIPAHTTAAILSGGDSHGGGVVNLVVQVDAKDAVLTESVKNWIVTGIHEAMPITIRAASAKVKQDLQRSAYNAIR